MISLKKILILYSLIALLSVGIVFSHGEEDFADAKQIVENKVPCSELTEEQLDHIGNYYMEQMHPGEAHELMDKMMGGEGSESLKQMHIQMAKRLYCNEDVGGMTSGIMGMMGGGMMNMAMGTGMMGNFGYGSGYLTFVNLLYVILLIGLIILVYLWIFRLLKGTKIKGGKK